MKGPGLIIALGKGKPSSKEGGGSYLKEAFDALKDDDFDGFEAAMEAWAEKCMGKKSSPKEDEDEDDY
jgi:hypothetical protein